MGTVLTVGNFDGVHIGHQRIIRTLRETADALKAKAVVVTFAPHSRFKTCLTTPAERERLLKKFGADEVVFLSFSDVRNLSPVVFVKYVEEKVGKIKAFVAGEDFRFGRNRSGNINTVKAMGILGIVVPKVRIFGKKVSSRNIRRLVKAGKITLVRTLLGRPFSVMGAKTEEGVLIPEEKLFPPSGRYLVRICERVLLAEIRGNFIKFDGCAPGTKGVVVEFLGNVKGGV